MTDLEYSKLPGWRSTSIKNILDYGLFDTIHQDGLITSSDAFAFGNVFHTLVLEPHEFDNRYAVMPSFDRRTKEGKVDAIMWETDNRNKEIISSDDYSLAKKMSEQTLKRYGHIIDQCEKEVAYTAEFDGTKVKCKVDLVSEKLGFFADLKSTAQEIKKRNIEKITMDYGYHVSYAFYKDIIELNGHKINNFGLLYTSKKDCRALFFEPSMELLERGRGDYAIALEKIKAYEKDGSIDDAAIKFDLPAWLKVDN